MILFNQAVLWCNVFRPERLAKIAAWNGGNFAGVLYDAQTLTKAQADAARATVRPDGTKLKVGLYEVPRGRSAAQLAADTHEHIAALGVGAVDWDVELDDAVQEQYIREAIFAFRETNPTFLLRINIAPFKGFTLPGDLFAADSNLYAAEQCYYGDMSPVRELDAWFDVSFKVPPTRCALCLGAATEHRPFPTGPRTRALGTISYQGAPDGKKLGPCEVFSDDLMVDLGML